MEGLVEFMQTESTQQRTPYNFYLFNEVYIVDPDKSKWIVFKPGQSYDRSVVRRFLVEYYMYSMRWIGTNEIEDGPRHYLILKSVKDYLSYFNKKTFTYEEIKDIVETQQILNYANDLQLYIGRRISFWRDRVECYTEMCTYKYKDFSDVTNMEQVKAMIYNPAYIMLEEFIEYNNNDLFYERVFNFDDWEKFMPIQMHQHPNDTNTTIR